MKETKAESWSDLVTFIFLLFGGWFIRVLILPAPATTTFTAFMINTSLRILLFLLPCLWLAGEMKIKMKDLFALHKAKEIGWLLAILYALAIIVFAILTNHQFKFNSNIIFWINLPFAPMIEELVFRGAIMTYLSKRLSPLMTILISTMLFVAIHIPGWMYISHLSIPALLLSSFQVFYFGLVLGYIRYKSNSVFPSIALHIFNNYFAFM